MKDGGTTDGAIVSKDSAYPFDETLARVERALKDAGNTIFARIDQAAAAQGAGLVLRPTVVLVFGNPKVGTALMQASPPFALELPLKIAIWRDDDGSVKLAYRSLRMLAASNPLSGKDDVLAKLDGAVGAMLDSALR